MQATTCTLSKHPSGLQPKRNYPEQIPFGWYFIYYSDELNKSDVQIITCFGQEWVLFRNEHGEVGVIEPYCPHLGAHIGVGGKVDGELIRCPFHAWGFDKTGHCRDVPYAKKLPPILKRGAVLDSLPVVEFNQIIWAWYHPQKLAPLWDVPAISNTDYSQWSQYQKFEFDVNTSVQDITENSVDYAHLKTVHGHTSDFNGEVNYDGINRTTRLRADVEIADSTGNIKRGPYSITLIQQGPGQQVVHYYRQIELVMMYLVTPVTSERTEVRFAFTHPNYPEGSYEESLVKHLLLEKIGAHGNLTGIEADIPIWNNKIYRPNPLLCDGDGPIMQFRSWFKQFYA